MSIQHPNPVTLASQDLPWDWFDFTTPPTSLQGTPADVDHGGAHRSYAATMDQRQVPFKVLRRASPRSAPRPTLLMMHGMGLNIATFHGLAGYLLPTHDLVLIDYSNLGVPHAWPPGGVSAKVMAESVWRVADALSLERASLVGNSLGGGLCLIAALMQPHRVEKLALANPACYPQPLPFMYVLARVPLIGETVMAISPAEKFVAGIEHIGYVDKTRFQPELRQRYLKQMAIRASRFRLMEMIRHLPGNARDLTAAAHVPRLKEITQPVLLAWGQQDPLLLKVSGPRLARDLPNCRHEIFPDLAHMPHEEAPERIGPVMAEFLNDKVTK